MKDSVLQSLVLALAIISGAIGGHFNSWTVTTMVFAGGCGIIVLWLARQIAKSKREICRLNRLKKLLGHD